MFADRLSVSNFTIEDKAGCPIDGSASSVFSIKIDLAPSFDDVNGCGIRVSDSYLWGVVSLVTILGFTVSLRDPYFIYVSDLYQYRRYFGDISFGKSQCFKFKCFPYYEKDRNISDDLFAQQQLLIFFRQLFCYQLKDKYLFEP